MNNLHAAVSYRCPKVVEMLLEDVSQQHKDRPDLASQVIKALDASYRSALTLAILKKDTESTRLLLRKERTLVQIGWGNPMVYPLHQLLRQAAEPAGCEDEPPLSTDQWCHMLEDLVKADPAFTLTKRCLVSDYPTSDGASEDEVTAYGLVEKNLEERDPLERSPLEAMRDKLERLIWRHLEGSDIKDAGLGSLSSQTPWKVGRIC
jgi:hypothetical protein